MWNLFASTLAISSFFKPVSAAPTPCLLKRAYTGQLSVTLQRKEIDVFQYKVNTK